MYRFRDAIISIVCLFAQGAFAQELISSNFGGANGVFGEGNASASVNASTGAPTAAYSFQLPIARGDAQPSLSLNYKLSRVMRDAGAGWGLALPVIERDTFLGPPDFSDSDRFTYSGRALVPLCDVPDSLKCSHSNEEKLPRWSYGWRYFRLQTEGLFGRFFLSPDRRTWRLQTKSGVMSEFGAPLVHEHLAGASLDTGGNDSQIFRWNLVREFDSRNPSDHPNVVIYVWKKFGLRQLTYLTDIFDTLSAELPGKKSGLDDLAHHTRIVWESHGFPIADYAPIWRATRKMRMRTVEVASKNASGAGSREMVRKYHLTYLLPRTDPSERSEKVSPLYRTSFLHQIEMEGRCPSPILENANPDASAFASIPDTNCPRLPPTTFQYSPGDVFPMFKYGQLRNVPSWLGGNLLWNLGTVALADINGDGLADIYQGVSTQPNTQPGAYGLLNQLVSHRFDTTYFDMATVSGPYDPSFLSAKEGISVFGYLGNKAGHGLLFAKNAIVAPGKLEFCKEASGLSGWSNNGCFQAPIPNLVGDFDGDGLIDIHTLRNGMDGEGRYVWISETQFSRRDLKEAEKIRFFSDVRASNVVPHPPYNLPTPTYLADMNGDGIPDLVTLAGEGIDDPRIVYYPGDGSGNFGCASGFDLCEAPTTVYDPRCRGIINHAQTCKLLWVRPEAVPGVPALPEAPSLFDSHIKFFANDINGDGLADLIFVNLANPGYGVGIYIYLNENGRGFRKFRNTSTPDLVLFDQSNPRRSFASARISFGDINGDGIDDLAFIHETGVQWVDFLYSHVTDPVRPGLLNKITNGFGLTKSITYKNIAVLDREASTWKVPWATHSRISQPVVAEVLASNGLPSDFATEERISFEYRDPAFDPWLGQFVGFRLVTVRDQLSAVTTKYLFGPCQPSSPANCPETSDDDELKALAGVPLVVDHYAPGGGWLVPGTFPANAIANASTVHTAYESRKLATGSDGRTVRYAFARQVDTYLYDTTNREKVSKTIEVTDYSLVNQEPPYHAKGNLTLWSVEGMEHLRTTQTSDDFGNITEIKHWGRLDAQDNPIDDPLVQTHTFSPQGRDGWQWRPTASSVKSGSGSGSPREFAFSYNAVTGDLRSIVAELKGTLPLDRSHLAGRPIAPNPPGASQDGPITLLEVARDSFGNVTSRQGPAFVASTGLSTRCEQFQYDKQFQQMVIGRIRHSDQCSASGFQDSFEFDRGFGLITRQKSATVGTFVTDFDAFGRPVAIYKPEAASTGIEATPSVKAEYFIAANDPVQKVKLLEKDGANSYRTTWLYLDGAGSEILSLAEADPAAGDETEWIASGLSKRQSGGLISEIYPNWGFTGNPQNHPIAAPYARAKPVARLLYDNFKRSTGQLNDTRHIAVSYRALSHDVTDAVATQSLGQAGSTTTFFYDGHFRLVKTSTPVRTGGGVEKLDRRYSYFSTGELSRVEQAKGGSSESISRWMQYDSLGRLVLNAEANTTAAYSPDPQSAPGLRAWRYAYNDAGLIVGSSDARGCGANFHYDGYARLVAMDHSPCRAEHQDYTLPNLVSGDGTELFLTYDRPEPSQVTDFGTSANYLQGQLTSVRDQGAHTRFAYDGRKRVTRISRRPAKPGNSASLLQDRYTSTWFRSDARYDDADRQISVSTGNALSVLFGAGNASELTRKFSKRGALVEVSGSYGTLLASAKYNPQGLPTSVVYGDVAMTGAAYQYDDTLRLTRYTLSRTAPTIWSNPPQPYVPPSPAEPNLRQLVLEDMKFSYDNAGNISKIEDSRNPNEWPAGLKPRHQTFTYDDLYRLSGVTYSYLNQASDQAVPAFAPESARPAAIPQTAALDRTKQQAFSYDWKGNLHQWTDDAGAFFSRSLGAIRYGSNNQGPNQLKSASGLNASANMEANYDEAGYLVDLVVKRPSPCDPQASDCSHRFVYQWDEIGRLANVRRWDYAQIPASEPVHPNAPATVPVVEVKNTYGLNGRTVQSTSLAGAEARFDVEILDTLGLRDTKYNSTSGNYEHAPETQTLHLGPYGQVVHAPSVPTPFVLNSGRHVYLQFSDWLGTSKMQIDRTTSELVQRTEFGAYGKAETDFRPARWGQSRNRIRFGGKNEDDSVGLINFGTRYYSQYLGRWISPDPLSIHGAAGDLNPYGFAQSNPVNFGDPIGFDTGCLGMEAICGGGSGGGGLDPIQIGPGQAGGGGGPAIPSRPSVSDVPRYPVGSSYSPTPPPPPTLPTTASSGTFNPAASVRDPLAKWILTSNSTFHNIVTNDDYWRYYQYAWTGVAVGAATIATGGAALELPAVGAATTSAMAEGAALLRTAAMVARLGLFKAPELFNASYSRAQTFVSSPAFKGLGENSAMYRAAQLHNRFIESGTGQRYYHATVAVIEGEREVVATNNIAIYRWLQQQFSGSLYTIVAPVVKEHGRNLHAELAGLRYALSQGFGVWRVGTSWDGCPACQEAMRRMYPLVTHANPKPGGVLAP